MLSLLPHYFKYGNITKEKQTQFYPMTSQIEGWKLECESKNYSRIDAYNNFYSKQLDSRITKRFFGEVGWFYILLFILPGLFLMLSLFGLIPNAHIIAICGYCLDRVVNVLVINTFLHLKYSKAMKFLKKQEASYSEMLVFQNI
jgi:hypothetical protein